MIDDKIQAGKRGLKQVVFGRTMVIFVLLLLQLATLFLLFRWLEGYSVFAYGVMTLLSVALVIHIINREISSCFKISWLIMVMAVPVMGTLFYVFLKTQVGSRVINQKLRGMVKETAPYLKQDPQVAEALRRENPDVANLARYIDLYGGYPVYRNSEVTYFPLGEDKFEEMKRQLEKARKFIFLEYFIVEPGLMWDSILEILKRKAKQGVEIRFMYDGTNTLGRLPYDYPKEMVACGIQCKVFAPVRPALTTVQNNRDHRKILVIDGHTAFTGGVNLADEYINRKERFGHWKDTAVMVRGDAVKSFTMMFLQMWNISGLAPESYTRYLRPEITLPQPAQGFVIPYGDSPLDNERVGELVYLDIVQHAREYLHICTPYLILDDEMNTALKFAAKRGVDVKLILPHIPDKQYAYLVARTHFAELIRAGVKIYEYTPGFVHAKSFVSDGQVCTVGTINLDFRSLYLHFECGVFVYGNPVVADVEADFQATLRRCQRITLANCREFPLVKKLAGKALRLVAPLL